MASIPQLINAHPNITLALAAHLSASIRRASASFYARGAALTGLATTVLIVFCCLFWSTSTGLAQDIDIVSPRRLAVSGDGKFLAAAVSASEVKVWELQTKELKWTIPVERPPTAVAFASLDRLIIGTEGYRTDVQDLMIGRLIAWSLTDSAPRIVWRAETMGQVMALALDPQAKFCAANTMYAQVGLYDVQTGQPLRCFQELGNPPADLTFDHHGTKLLTAGQALILWNPRLLGPGEQTPQPLPALDGEQSRPYAEHQLGGAVSVVASKRQPWLIAAGIYAGPTGHANDVVEVDQTTFQIKRELIRDLDGISCMALSPDESTLAIGTDQGDVLLYQVASGQPIRAWKTPEAIPVRSLLFVDDQQLAAAGMFGDLVLLFDANSGKTQALLHQKPRSH